MKTENNMKSIAESVVSENRRLRRSLKITIGVYLLLFIAVIAYTSFVMYRIKELATPQALSAQICYYVKSKIPGFQSYLEKQVMSEAPEISRRLADYGHTLIPQAEKAAEVQLNAILDCVIDRLRMEYMPALNSYVETSIMNSKDNMDIVKDKNLALQLSQTLADELDREMGRVIDARFFDKLRQFREEIEYIGSRPEGSMTRKELAEKRFLICWMYLVNHAEPGESSMADAIQSLNSVIKDVDFSIGGEAAANGEQITIDYEARKKKDKAAK